MKEYLTNRQIAFLMFGIIVGYGVMPLTKNIVEKTGTGGWFSLSIATVIAIILTYIFTYLGYVHENKTIDEYSELLTGKIITFIFISIYIIYYFLGCTMVTRLASEMVKHNVLPETPIWVLSLLILSVTYYAVIKRLQNIAKICEIYGMLISVVAVTTIITMFTQGKSINLKPFFVVEDIKIYFKAIPVTIGPLLGMELISIIPFNRKKNDKKIFRYTACMVGFIGLIYIFELEACMAIMGQSVIYYESSLLATIRRIEITSFQFLSRLDGIIIVFWLMAVLCTVIIWAYGAVFLIHKYCRRIHFNRIAFMVIVFSFIVSRMPKTVDQVEVVYKYISYMGFVAAGVIPMILFIITKIKKYDKNL